MYSYLFIYFVATLHGTWDLSPLTRDPSGTESVPPAVEAQSLNHWTTRKACARSVAQLCPTLGDPMDCSLPGSSVHGNFQARILERVAISFSRGSSQLRNWAHVSLDTSRFWSVLIGTSHYFCQRCINSPSSSTLQPKWTFQNVVYSCSSFAEDS